MEIEKSVLKKAIQGDEEAFTALVEFYQERVYWLAYHILQDAEEAKDIAQEAFLRVYRSLHRFSLEQSFYTWLYQIVVNLCIDHFRRQKRKGTLSLEELPEPEWECLSPSLGEEELTQKVEKVLARIPPKYRIVLYLRDVEGLTSKEISKIIGASHTTTRWRLHQARQMFRSEWEKLFPEDPSEVAKDQETYG